MTLMEGANAEGNSMTYSAESLAALSDMDLDDLVEEKVMGREPESGLLDRLRRSALLWYAQLTGAEAPSYSGSEAGMGLVFAALVEKGLTVALAPGGVVWVAGNGKEMKYVGGVTMPRAVAIAAVLAMQGG
jgi:hypothetical protein